MDPIDPTTLEGIPAPYWFVQFFKVLGFTLHMVPMNLWLVGIALALWMYARGDVMGKHFAGRLMRQMPIVIAYGVNLGIVPLLFVQLAYSQLFYPATILMAWFWFAIVVLMIGAYHGAYSFSFGWQEGGRGMTTFRHIAGWTAAVLFVVIGFLFVNAFSLMSNVGAWRELWAQHSHAGAALGTALNLADGSLWPRWLLMFGLACLTTAAWILVDLAWFAKTATDEYRQWASRFAFRLATVGAVWFAVTGSWYVFGTWTDELRATMFSGPMAVLTLLTAGSVGLPWLLIFMNRGRQIGCTMATFVGLAQFGVLAINATSRQVVQNIKVSHLLDVSARPLAVQWSPLIAFLLAFVAGLAVVAWMVWQVLKTNAAEKK